MHQDLLKEADVLHRDLNLNTILINKDGRRKALLSGFAMAKAPGLEHEESLLDKDYLVVCASYHLLR